MTSLFDLLTSPGVMPGLLMQHTMTLRSLTPAKIEKVKQLLTKHTIRGAAMYGGVSYFTALQIKRGKYEKYKMKEINN